MALTVGGGSDETIQGGGGGGVPEAFRRFVLIAPGRSGSTYVRKQLSAHSCIDCFGEILSPSWVIGYPEDRQRNIEELRRERNADPLGFIRNHLYPERACTQAGFKLLYPQFDMPKAHVRLADLRDDFPDMKVIMLWRRDLLARYRSYFLSIRKNRKDFFSLHRQTMLQVEYIRLDCEWQKAKRLHVRETFRDRPVHEVYYEDLLVDADGQFRNMCEFLGVDGDFPEQKPDQTVRVRKKEPENIDGMLAKDILAEYRNTA